MEWDFGPSGQTLYNTTLVGDENAAVFFKNDPAAGHIGGKYMKCLYHGYTDSTFSTRIVRTGHWAHLGMLGPLIRAEVGDAIKVHYSNKCTKVTSINVPGVLKSKAHEGWHYGKAASQSMASSGVVSPGGKFLYE